MYKFTYNTISLEIIFIGWPQIQHYDIPSSAVLRHAQYKAGGYGIVVIPSKTTIPYPFAPTSLSDDGILFLKKRPF